MTSGPSGAYERVDDPDDPRIAGYHAVREPELARTQGLFVAEGRLVVQRVLASRRFRVRSVLLNEAACRALAAHLAQRNPAVSVYVCRTDDLPAITGHNLHRGCLALVERPAPMPVVEATAHARAVVALEAVGNPDNVGGVFRNAAAFGAAVVLGPGCADPWYRKTIRTSMGAVLSVPWAHAATWPADLRALRATGFRIAALTPSRPSEPLEAFAARSRPQRLVLLAGTEGAGLTLDAEGAADHHIRIPISAAVDSLNVVVAVGIALSRLTGETA